jgi:hypothetical protein
MVALIVVVTYMVVTYMLAGGILVAPSGRGHFDRLSDPTGSGSVTRIGDWNVGRQFQGLEE